MLYIGRFVQDRMDLLGLTADSLAEEAFLEKLDVENIINDNVAFENIDEFDLSLISNVLHCKPEFFINESIRKKDLLMATMNRGNDTEKSMNVKAKVQDFMNDFTFIDRILSEEN